ncbi:MAG: DUF427 domain-containing protein, partial [Alphaproteobacteria bacterium]
RRRAMVNVRTRPRASGGYAERPDYDVHFEPCPRRLRVAFGGTTVVDSTRARYLFETDHVPIYYFPRADVRMDLLTRTDHRTTCPYKGDAGYFSVTWDGRTAENAAWTYDSPFPEVAEIKDYLAFYWDRMDHWYEEDDEVFVHARDPYKRVDVVASRRPIEVVLGGTTVARSTGARFLFETGLPTRYYLPAADVRMDLLTPSDTTTRCPYKGTARYWHATVGGRRFENVVWSYPDPIPEAARIKGLLAFFDEHMDEVRVDGAVVPRGVTPWSNGKPATAAR